MNGNEKTHHNRWRWSCFIGIEAMDTSIEIAGYVDNIESKKLILPYLGNDEFVLSNFSPEEYRVHHAVVYTNDVNLSLRSRIIQQYEGYESYTIIARSALVTSSSKIAGMCSYGRRYCQWSHIGTK